MLKKARNNHDIDKFHDFPEMYKTINANQLETWFKGHIKVSRHHLQALPDDVNLIDILEMISDVVTANMSKLSKGVSITVDPATLEKAVTNTVKLLMGEIVVKG